MTTLQLFHMIRERFLALNGVSELIDSDAKIEIRPLAGEAVLGGADRTDYPILNGKDILQQAEFGQGKGQSFTSQPAAGAFTVRELAELPLDTIRNQGVFAAGINAVMHSLGLIGNTVHCEDNGPECCARNTVRMLTAEFSDVKLTLIGYQPALFAALSKAFPRMRVTDLNPERIGTEHFGITVEDGASAQQDVCDWADLILCTGSTLANGTFLPFYELAQAGKDIRFYGTTIAGAAKLLNLKRICFADGNGEVS